MAKSFHLKEHNSAPVGWATSSKYQVIPCRRNIQQDPRDGSLNYPLDGRSRADLTGYSRIIAKITTSVKRPIKRKLSRKR